MCTTSVRVMPTVHTLDRSDLVVVVVVVLVVLPACVATSPRPPSYAIRTTCHQRTWVLWLVVRIALFLTSLWGTVCIIGLSVGSKLLLTYLWYPSDLFWKLSLIYIYIYIYHLVSIGDRLDYNGWKKLYNQRFFFILTQWPGAQNLQNTEELVAANQEAAYNRMFKEMFSKPPRDWLQLTLQCFASCVHPASGLGWRNKRTEISYPIGWLFRQYSINIFNLIHHL